MVVNGCDSLKQTLVSPRPVIQASRAVFKRALWLIIKYAQSILC
jgi:hypothetical protein